jgi:hypothetical protein
VAQSSRYIKKKRETRRRLKRGAFQLGILIAVVCVAAFVLTLFLSFAQRTAQVPEPAKEDMEKYMEKYLSKVKKTP